MFDCGGEGLNLPVNVLEFDKETIVLEHSFEGVPRFYLWSFRCAHLTVLHIRRNAMLASTLNIHGKEIQTESKNERGIQGFYLLLRQ